MVNLFKTFFGKVGSWLKTGATFTKEIFDSVGNNIAIVTGISIYCTLVSGSAFAVWKLIETAVNLISKGYKKIRAFAC